MTGAALSREIVRVLRVAVPGLQLVLLFGSHARGDATAASDVDVALLASEVAVPVPRSRGSSTSPCATTSA